MRLKNGVYIIECTPQKDDVYEGVMLYEFLNMIIRKNKIKMQQAQTKTEFFKKLAKNKHKVVHISCHGNGKYIFLPKGDIEPTEFYANDGLNGRNVVITGCSLGLAGFARDFLEKTQAKSLISPLKTITFEDSAMWCVNFYYHLFTRSSFSFGRSYDYMKDRFDIKGAMQMWEE